MRHSCMVFLVLPIALTALACSPGEGVPGPVENRAETARAPAGGRLIGPVPAGEWHLPAGDYANTRYSPLAQLTPQNVAKLKITSTLSTGIPHGHEGQPLVVGDTMYIVTPFPNNLIAVDLTKPGGALKWIYQPHPDPRSVGIACCDIVNRGASYAGGKIIYNLLDSHTVAVDAETGREVWRTKTGEINRGGTTTMAALVVKDKVIVGNSGGELGVRGWVLALDVGTGREVWRAYNTGPDRDVRIGPQFRAWYAKDRGTDLGVRTWPPGQWKLGGSTVWGWVSYDPGLDLIYYGTGNPGVWNPDLRPGDNKWSLSIFARDPDDGMARWAYQVTPHDAWDYDEIMENVLVDLPVEGRMRKLLVHPARNGFVFVLDRETGEVLSAEKFLTQSNWADRYDLKTGLPVENPGKRSHEGTVTQGICPSSTGAKEFVPSAFSPRTGLLYIPAVDARNGTELWKFKTGSGIVGNPITYLGPDGKQYVAIYSGVGGWMGAVAFPTISTDDPYAALGVVGAMKDIKNHTGPGDVLYVFGI